MVKYFDKHVSGQMLNELQEVMKSISEISILTLQHAA